MESNVRTIAKAVSWQVIGLFVTTALAWLLTGSMAEAGGFALASAALALVTYVIHERIWQRIRWGIG